MSDKTEPVAWLYEIQPPKDDEWYTRASTLHPVKDEGLGESELVQVRNIQPLIIRGTE